MATPTDLADLVGGTLSRGTDSYGLRKSDMRTIAPYAHHTSAPQWIAVDGAELVIAPVGASYDVEVNYVAKAPTPPAAPDLGTIGTPDQVTSAYYSLYLSALMAAACEWSKDLAAEESWLAKYAARVELANGASDNLIYGGAVAGAFY